MYPNILRMHLTRYFIRNIPGQRWWTWRSWYCSSSVVVGREEFATGTFPRTRSTASIIFQKWTDGERAQVDLFLVFLRQYKITNRYALLVVISENNWIQQYFADFPSVRTLSTTQLFGFRAALPHKIIIIIWPIIIWQLCSLNQKLDINTTKINRKCINF